MTAGGDIDPASPRTRVFTPVNGGQKPLDVLRKKVVEELEQIGPTYHRGHGLAVFAFTLPTEAQWEYACRAGTKGEYAGDVNALAWYGGSAPVAGFLFFGADSILSRKADSGPYPVGRKKPNAWGFYDMHGNAQEWCRDRYAVQLPGGSVVDPTGPSSGVVRVQRGGTWFQSAPECTSAARALPFTEPVKDSGWPWQHSSSRHSGIRPNLSSQVYSSNHDFSSISAPGPPDSPCFW